MEELYRETEATMRAGTAVVTRLHVLEMFLCEQIAKSQRANFDF